jgi:beta-lactamase class A
MSSRAPATERRKPRPGGSRGLAAVEQSLYTNVQRIKKQHRLERLGISFFDSQTTLQWSYNADSLFHAASTMKIAVLVGVYRQIARGELRADDPVHVRNRFASIVDGSHFALTLGSADADVGRRLGRTMSVRLLCYEMITRSSNLATNLLIDVVGVPTMKLALEELQVDGVFVKRGVSDEAAYQAGINNLVTANGLLKLLRVIADGRAWSPQACADMLEILLDQRSTSGIPAGLPEGAAIAHKTGNISNVHHDAGIVYIGNRRPYFLVVLTQFDPKIGRSAAVADVSRDVHKSLTGLSRDPEPVETV